MLGSNWNLRNIGTNGSQLVSIKLFFAYYLIILCSSLSFLCLSNCYFMFV